MMEKFKDMPWFLPPGSIRSLLAIMIVAPFSYGIYKLFETGQLVITAEQLMTIIVLVFNAYFLSKKLRGGESNEKS